MFREFAPWTEIFAPWNDFRTFNSGVRNFHTLICTVRNLAWGVRNGTRVPGGGFARCENFRTLDWGVRNSRSARSSFLAMTITFSFQLGFGQRLKCWTTDFPSFETVYSMYKMDSRKYSKICPKVATEPMARILSSLPFLSSFLQSLLQWSSKNLC